ncbi:MAG: GYF domain-containing protein, partial [Planctomycetia bacterium]|nr:GYF domain-containing protein [Planctomycetia bacterium]
MKWYYRKNSESPVQGPVSSEELEKLVASGEVGRGFDFRQDEDGLWFPAWTFSESFPFATDVTDGVESTVTSGKIPGPFRAPITHPVHPVIPRFRPRHSGA